MPLSLPILLRSRDRLNNELRMNEQYYNIKRGEWGMKIGSPSRREVSIENQVMKVNIYIYEQRTILILIKTI